MISFIGPICIAVGGTGLVGIALYGVINLWEAWLAQHPAPECVSRPPRRIGKVFPDEGDIDIALEIVNGKRLN